MPRPRIGSNRFQNYGLGRQLESFPERKIITFRDFRRGFTPSEQRQMADPAASPVTRNMEIRDDNRLQRVPGTRVLSTLDGREPQRMALHPTLSGFVELALFAPPEVGFRGVDDPITWTDIGLADRDEFASTTFGGTLIFTDGINAWYKETSGSNIKELPEAPMARAYATFAGRVFAFGTLIDGQFERLGARWTAADSNFKNWDGFGSGFELLINDVSSGDEILSAIPMSLDTMAIMMRQSIWIGRFTGQALRPVDFQVRVTGVGAINRHVSVLSRFGVFFLSDKGVYLFDGNTAILVSESINAGILPIDYSRLDEYHATYDPTKKRYILFTPTEMWQYEVEHQRWLKRTFTTNHAVMFPTQIDGVRWFEAVGTWEEQTDLIWLDFAPQNLGELNLYMLGDEHDEQLYASTRVLAEESRKRGCFFGKPFTAYWETKLADEQNAQNLVTIKKQLVEYEGRGCLRIYLPDEDNQYVQVLETILAPRNYPSTAVFNAEKVSKGTGVGIEFCELPCIALPREYEYEPEENGPGGVAPEPPEYEPEQEEYLDWVGFTIMSDAHACTQEEGAQQVAPLQIACFVWCDDPVCGGPGGFLVWYSNNPEELEQGCSHPNNPIPGMLS